MPGHMLSVDLLETSQPRWRRLLREMRDDPYGSPEYLEFAARHEEAGSPVAAIVKHDGNDVMSPTHQRSHADSSRGHRRDVMLTTELPEADGTVPSQTRPPFFESDTMVVLPLRHRPAHP